MKTTLKYLTKLFIISSLSLTSQVQVNVNIGTPPPWGPPGHVEVRYYYLPDIEVYYDIQTASFIYFGNGRWIYTDVLPVRYAYYDLYGGYKVMVHDYFGPKPFLYYKTHKVKYPKGYKGPPPTAHPKGKFKKDGAAPSPLYKLNNNSGKNKSAGKPGGNKKGNGQGKSKGKR